MTDWLAVALSKNPPPCVKTVKTAKRGSESPKPLENNNKNMGLLADPSVPKLCQKPFWHSEKATKANFEPETAFPIPGEWSDGLASLDRSCPPDRLHIDRWGQILDDAERFMEQWGAKAAALGWRTLDIFGCSPGAPDVRPDQKGLVMLLRGRPILAMTADSARIEATRGFNTFYRIPQESGVPIWTLERIGPIEAAGPSDDAA